MAKQGSSVKKFLHTKDFYNWIKDSTGNNSPATFYWFSVVFYYPIIGSTNDIFFFGNNLEKNLEDLRYCVQQIQLPKINYTGYNAQGQAGTGTIDASNMYGTYTVLGNSYLGITQKTFTMKVLNTYSPIIEKFLYPWMIKCLQPNVEKDLGAVANFPRLDMAINFWKPNCIYEDMEGQRPEFMYYLKGIFPSSIQAYNPIQSAGGGDNNRDVEFTFNQFVMIPNANIANHFGLGHLFSGSSTINETKWWANMVKTWIANAASASVAAAARHMLKPSKPKPVTLKINPKLNKLTNQQSDLKPLDNVSSTNNLGNKTSSIDLLSKELINSRNETKSSNIDLNIGRQDIEKYNPSNYLTLDEQVERVRNDNEFDDIIETEGESESIHLSNVNNDVIFEYDGNQIEVENETEMLKYIESINLKQSSTNNLSYEPLEHYEVDTLNQGRKQDFKYDKNNLTNFNEETVKRLVKGLDSDTELTSSERVKSNKKVLNDPDLISPELIKKDGKYVFNDPDTLEQEHIETVKRLVKEETIENIARRHSDMEDEDELIEVEDEADVIVGSMFNQNTILGDNRGILIDNKIIGYKGQNETINYEHPMIIRKGTQADLIDQYKFLLNNKTINQQSYNFLNDYAKTTNQDVKDVIKTYKSLDDKELNNFIISLSNNSTISKNTIEKAERNTDKIINYEHNHNDKIKSSDLDDLFS